MAAATVKTRDEPRYPCRGCQRTEQIVIHTDGYWYRGCAHCARLSLPPDAARAVARHRYEQAQARLASAIAEAQADNRLFDAAVAAAEAAEQRRRELEDLERLMTRAPRGGGAW